MQVLVTSAAHRPERFRQYRVRLDTFTRADFVVVAGLFAVSLKVGREHSVSGGVQEERAADHARPIRPHAMEEQHCPTARSASHEPALNQTAGLAGKCDGLGA